MTDVQNFGTAARDDDGDVFSVDDPDSVYDDLKAELSAVKAEDVLWRVVPINPTIEVGFNTQIDFDMLRAWLKAANVRKNGKREFNPLNFAYIVLSNTTAGIKVKGRQATTNGRPLLLSHQEAWDLIGVQGTKDMIKRLFTKDGHILAMSREVMEAAGYGDVDMDEGDAPLETA